MIILKWIHRSAGVIAQASQGNPVLSVLTVFLFYLAFNMLEAMVETLIWGERFEHWLDPLFIGAFMAYSGYVVWACALYQIRASQTDS